MHRPANACGRQGFRLEVWQIAAIGVEPLESQALRPRLAAIDAARGVAITAMVVFHFFWDLYYLGFTDIDVTTEPGWVVFQKSILTSFLLLVGAGLVLAHGDGIRWRGFWRRFALILGGALLTTAGTFAVLPQYFVYFGILHAIAAFSLVGLGFVRAPWWAAALGAVAFLLAPLVVPSDPVMMLRQLSWIGFWPLPPPTTDIVPFFPWFGTVLAGMAGTKVLMRSGAWPALTSMKLSGPAGRALRWMGRWSLVIYLVHQPLIYGALNLIPRPAAPDALGFVQSCEATCALNGEPGFCARYCLCALEEVEAENLWDAIARPETATAAQSLAIDAMTRLCEAMAVE
jgi:uncharacterized membrane protein